MSTDAPKTRGTKNGTFKTSPNPFSQTKEKATFYLALTQGVGSVIDSVLHSGCAVLIGRTRDGGAISITILDGDDRHRTYCASQIELDNAFAAMHDIYA